MLLSLLDLTFCLHSNVRRSTLIGSVGIILSWWETTFFWRRARTSCLPDCRPNFQLSILGPFLLLLLLVHMHLNWSCLSLCRHPVFHVSQLKPFVPSAIEAVPTQPPPVYADRRGGIFVVEAILSKRKYRGRWQYLVKWDGYDDTENTWEPASNLQHLVGDLADQLAAAPLVP